MEENDKELLEDIPQPPDHLGKYAEELWKHLVPELVRNNSLAKQDLPTLEILCDNYQIYRETKLAIYTHINPETGKRKKRTLEEYLSGGNSQTTPELTAMNKAFSHYKDLMTQFGLSPLARTKTKAEAPPEESPFKSYMKMMEQTMKGSK